MQNKLDSAASYIGGTSLIAVSSLADIATIAQQLGMILGFIVIAVKLVYDVIKFKREIIDKKKR